MIHTLSSLFARKDLPRVFVGSRLIPLGIAAFLLVAALLKVRAYAWGSGADGISLGVALYEIALSVWLIGGWFPKRARQAAVLTFVAFAAYSLFNAFQGAVECGCFGEMSLSPWVMAVVDLTCVALLLAFPPDGSLSLVFSNAGQPSAVNSCTWITGAAFCITAAVVIGGFVFAAAEGEDPQRDDSAVVLDPNTWPGRRFPLLNHTDISSELSRGSWTVLIVRPGCTACERLLADGRIRSQAETSGGKARRVALLEMPPQNLATTHRLRDAPNFLHGRIHVDKEWIMNTPFEITLNDSIVAEVNNTF